MIDSTIILKCYSYFITILGKKSGEKLRIMVLPHTKWTLHIRIFDSNNGSSFISFYIRIIEYFLNIISTDSPLCFCSWLSRLLSSWNSSTFHSFFDLRYLLLYLHLSIFLEKIIVLFSADFIIFKIKEYSFYTD